MEWKKEKFLGRHVVVERIFREVKMRGEGDLQRFFPISNFFRKFAVFKDYHAFPKVMILDSGCRETGGSTIEKGRKVLVLLG